MYRRCYDNTENCNYNQRRPTKYYKKPVNNRLYNRKYLQSSKFLKKLLDSFVLFVNVI